MAATSALAVANFILEKAAFERISIRHLKLQKLIYFCYAWYAGNTEKRLFSEDIEAWKLGPVVREVYLQFKDFRSSPIHTRATELDWETSDLIEPEVSEEVADDLLSVWNAYKRKSDAWLVEATHADDEPWGILVKQAGMADKRRIPFSLIKKVYTEKVADIAA